MNAAWEWSPQGAQITAFLDRLSTLTEDERDQINLAWYQCPYVARENAKSALFNSASPMAPHRWMSLRAVYAAARDIFEDAPQPPQSDLRLASFAAAALSCRDLIDETAAWNRAAYDALTTPFRVVFPVHPGDEDIREVA